MKKIIIVLIIAFHFQYSFSQNANVYLNPQLGHLYFGIANNILITSDDNKCDNYQVMVCDTILKINNCMFKFVPSCIGWTDFILQDMNLLQSDTLRFYVESVNDFNVSLNRRNPEYNPIFDSLTIKSELLDKLFVPYEITGFKVMLFSNDTIEIFNKSGRFEQQTVSEIYKLKKDNMISIYEITLTYNNREYILPDKINYRIR